jgi:threonine dehydratase
MHKKNLHSLLFVFISLLTLQTTIAAPRNALCLQNSIDFPALGFSYVEFDQQRFADNVAKRRAANITPANIDTAKFLQREFSAIPQATPFFTLKELNKAVSTVLNKPMVVYLKDETINATGSFKDRMPIRFYSQVFNDIQQLKAQKNKNESSNLKLMSVSTGNHGKASALAANLAKTYIAKQGLENNFSVTAQITMSAGALPHKKQAIKDAGGQIRDQYAGKPIPSYEAAEDIVVRETQNNRHNLLLPHADANAINGYGVIADEMIEQATEKGLHLSRLMPGELVMLVPLGSGGILSGTEEISARYKNIYSIGVTAPPADLTYRSLLTCQMIRTEQPLSEKLVVDGVMATPESFSLERIREVAKGVMRIRQQDALYATALLKLHGVNIEPTSGLVLAGLLLGKNEDFKQAKYAFLVLTGKNIAPDMVDEINKLVAQGQDKLLSYFKQRREEIRF